MECDTQLLMKSGCTTHASSESSSSWNSKRPSPTLTLTLTLSIGGGDMVEPQQHLNPNPNPCCGDSDDYGSTATSRPPALLGKPKSLGGSTSTCESRTDSKPGYGVVSVSDDEPAPAISSDSISYGSSWGYCGDSDEYRSTATSRPPRAALQERKKRNIWWGADEEDQERPTKKRLVVATDRVEEAMTRSSSTDDQVCCISFSPSLRREILSRRVYPAPPRLSSYWWPSHSQ